MPYSNDLIPKNCTEADRSKTMIAGQGGGYGFEITLTDRLNRFLILGHEGGTYYAGQRELTLETVDCLDDLVELGPEIAVDQIVEVSQAGRAPSNTPAIFALAYLTSKVGTRESFLAMRAMPKVCRTSTHLFQYLNFCKDLGRGWGTAFKAAVAKWYTDKTPISLAYQVTKYRNREGWTHRDVLRKCHAYGSKEQNEIFDYVTKPEQWLTRARIFSPAEVLLAATEESRNPIEPQRAIQLINNYDLAREHLHTSLLNDIGVWDALIHNNMPMTAMIRNLGKMSSVGLLGLGSEAVSTVCDRLTNESDLKKSRIHPFQLLVAKKVYQRGCGVRGSLSWTVLPQILDALEDGFYKSFEYLEPTGKTIAIGVDCSYSMSNPVIGSELVNCREAAAVMAMVIARTERNYIIRGFSETLVDLGVTARDTLDSCMQKLKRSDWKTTRCSALIEWAEKENLNVDAFAIMTDNETNRGPHPYSALQSYRGHSGCDAKLGVFGFAHSNFSIADPNDSGMMDFIGFDSYSPMLFNQFIS